MVRFDSILVVLVLALASASVGFAADPRGENEKRESPTGKPAASAGEKVKVYTNEDLPSLTPADQRSAPSEDDTAGAGESVAPLSYDTYVDRNGRGADYWVKRAVGLEADIQWAETLRDDAYRRMRHARLDGDPGYRWDYLDAEAKLERLKAQRAVLREEARTAGALPAWLSVLGGDPEPRERESPRVRVDLASPEQLSPEPGTIFDHSPRQTTLAWRSVSGASSYQVEIQYRCRAVQLWCPFAFEMDLTRTEYTFVFERVGRGRWRVRSSTADGLTSRWSGWREFRYVYRP